MVTGGELPLREELWVNLTQRIVHQRDTWVRLMEEIGFKIDSDASPAATLRYLGWLVPLAEVLQVHTLLQNWYPVLHHAVLELKPEPYAREGLLVYAKAEGFFYVTLEGDHKPLCGLGTVSSGQRRCLAGR